ncbi:PTS sugar transporter subunit IIA [Parasphaerochaeta coccoides]|uniref:PTS IIA-like nitrogen-regulatory protein PtsN n=1 Tax=Parasphaerochaeta coccoides (strain ATCC BAA-1237 / DSM 17374 / SPN1) TaxID=760011 RepID=F4GKE1_PARC1|nr:PTS sugar transporter subunit IIA [Parasphaerochaeta coccoides]AEC02337.1 putative PTS IIA-like nitrogen-regulatory protein PtsN [Parasphaerochaeta coccoides DSM 17374]
MGYIFTVDTNFTCPSLPCRIFSHGKYEAMDEVIEHSPAFADFPDLDEFKRIVRRREKMGTTGIGHGVAIAHGKVRFLKDIRVGLGVSVEGVDYGAVDGNPVHLLFVIASSPTLQMDYLRILSRILRAVRDVSVRTDLVEYVSAWETMFPKDADVTMPASCVRFLALLDELMPEGSDSPCGFPSR